jgi:hypothetical protein
MAITDSRAAEMIGWIGEQAVGRFDLMSGEETRQILSDRCRNLSLITLDPMAALESTRHRMLLRFR